MVLCFLTIGADHFKGGGSVVVAGGGDAIGISASYSMAALTLSASMKNEASDEEDETAIGITYAINDALTFSYKSIKPGSRASDDFGDE